MMEQAKEYAVKTKTDEVLEAAVQEVESLVADIERLFPQVEKVIGAKGDFGREALAKARTVVEKARQAVGKRDLEALKAQVEGLGRTQRMFKGVVTKGA